MCFSVTVTTFTDKVTAGMNKLIFISFYKVGWEQLSGEVGNSVGVLFQIYFSIYVPKIIKLQCSLTKLLQKYKMVQFFASQCSKASSKNTKK